MILQVRSGAITAKQGARQLGISRKSYYQWENRGLQGLLAAVEQQEPGRRPQGPTSEVQALEQRIQELEAELKLMKDSARLRALLRAGEQEKKQSKSTSPKNKASKAAPKKKPLPKSWP